MKQSKITKKYKWARLLIVLNWIMCFGTAAILICLCAAGVEASSSGISMKEKLGTVIYGFGMSLIPIVVLAILVKDKVRPTVWMLDIILANYLYDSLGMYIVLGVWVIAEYIVLPLSKRFASLYLINREMDKRL